MPPSESDLIRLLKTNLVEQNSLRKKMIPHMQVINHFMATHSKYLKKENAFLKAKNIKRYREIREEKVSALTTLTPSYRKSFEQYLKLKNELTDLIEQQGRIYRALLGLMGPILARREEKYAEMFNIGARQLIQIRETEALLNQEHRLANSLRRSLKNTRRQVKIVGLSPEATPEEKRIAKLILKQSKGKTVLEYECPPGHRWDSESRECLPVEAKGVPMKDGKCPEGYYYHTDIRLCFPRETSEAISLPTGFHWDPQHRIIVPDGWHVDAWVKHLLKTGKTVDGWRVAMKKRGWGED